MRTRNLSILFVSLLVIAGAVFAAGARAEGEVPAPPAIGATIEDFSLPDVDNKDRSLKSLAGKNGTVLLFIAVQCPVPTPTTSAWRSSLKITKRRASPSSVSTRTLRKMRRQLKHTPRNTNS